MAFIDYGALLRVDGKFINKNGNLFMDASDTGYICESAKEKNGETVPIDGGYFVYAGDEKCLLIFYKGIFQVISNGIIVLSDFNPAFASQTYKLEGLTELKVSHLDKNLYIEYPEPLGTWEDYVRQNWIDATGTEKLSQLYGGLKRYKRFKKRAKHIARVTRNGGYCKYRTQRYLAEWTYDNRKYEVIFGYGIDPDEEVWNRIKEDSYGFTDTERKIIDEWFAG